MKGGNSSFIPNIRSSRILGLVTAQAQTMFFSSVVKVIVMKSCKIGLTVSVRVSPD